jgi:hypothetical protein
VVVQRLRHRLDVCGPYGILTAVDDRKFIHLVLVDPSARRRRKNE